MSIFKNLLSRPTDNNRNQETANKKIVEKIIHTANLSTSGKEKPSYQVIAPDEGALISRIRQTVVNQRLIAGTTEMLIFLAAEDSSGDDDHDALTAVGTAMVTAALQGVDSIAVEDFDGAEVDALLEMGNSRYRSVALLTF